MWETICKKCKKLGIKVDRTGKVNRYTWERSELNSMYRGLFIPYLGFFDSSKSCSPSLNPVLHLT